MREREPLSWLRLLPSFWFQQQPYSAAWDSILTRLLDKGEHFIPDGEHNANICGWHVWTSNYPYSCMTTCGVRPSLPTIRRAYRQQLEDRFGEERRRLEREAAKL